MAASTANGRSHAAARAADLSSRVAALDSFTFSDEIERELAGLDGGAPAAAAAGVTQPAAPASSTSTGNTYASNAATAAATRAAVANPQAYAEAHFATRNTLSVAARASHTRPLSIDANAAERSAAGTRHQSPKHSTASHRPPADQSAAAHAAAARVAFSSGPAASPSSMDPSHQLFYDDELGASSFPLLPHNSLFDDEMLASEQRALALHHGRTPRGTPDQAFSPSGRVHAQHFTSILNQPISRLQHAAGPAIVGASGFLPSLASIWTFTTGVQPPEMVARASDDLLSFTEEASAGEPTPFVLPPCPALGDPQEQIEAVARYLKAMQPHAAIYRRNHPSVSLAERAAALRKKGTDKVQAASLRSHAARERGRASVNRSQQHRMLGIAEDSDIVSDGVWPSSSATPDIQGEEVDADAAAAKAAMERDLRDCYATVPDVYFAEEFQLASLEFWQNQSDLSFVVERQSAMAGGRSPGGTPINPYASFDALSSYHSSQHFTLPSLAEQKAAQLRAYKAAQERQARISEVNEQHTALQVELSAYLDRVEVTLLQQISQKSWVFFQGLSTVRAIQEEVAQALQRIGALRAQVAGLKSTLSDAGLAVLRQVRRLDNTLKLIRTNELVSSVLKTSPTVQQLLAAGDFAAAMQLIQSTKQLLAGELAGVKCLKHVQIKLVEHTKLIARLMQMEFVGVAIRGGNFYLHDLGTASLEPSQNSRAKGKLSASPHRTLSDEEQERLVPLVSHLLELDQLAPVVAAWQEELQALLKQRIMDFVADIVAKASSDETAHADANAKEEDAKAGKEDADGEAETKLNERDQVAANSLLDGQSSATAETPQNNASPMSVVSPAAATSTASSAASAPVTVAAPVAPPVVPTATPPRRQPVIAMPVNAHASTVTSAAPPAASTAAAASSTASAVVTPSPQPAAPSPASSTNAAVTPPSASPAPAAAPSIASRLLSMPHDEFLSLLLPLFSSLMDVIQRAGAVRHLALTVLANSAVAPAQKDALTRVLNDALITLLESAHGKIGKILQTRAPVHAALELRALRHFLDLILNFIQEGERLAGKTFYGLRGTLLVQAKAFLAAFHASSLATLGASLEREKWTRVDVPAEFQQLIDSHFVVKKDAPGAALKTSASVDALAEAESRLAGAAGTPTPKSSPEGPEEDASKATDANGTASSPSAAKAEEPAADVKRVLFVAHPPANGASGPPVFLRFPVVQSLLVLLKLVSQYVECAAQLQAVGSDILSRLAELLQMFNSRSCQLVLGAGAMHLSGLKSITASHLALASQSVGLLVTQLPVLRAALSARLPAKHHVLLQSLDRVGRDCQEHQREIFAKLVAIMDELVRHARNTLEQQPWARTEQTTASTSPQAHAALPTATPLPSPSPGPGASTSPPLLEEASRVDDCVRTLMKQTCSLHRALSDLLLPEQRDLVFVDIGRLFVRHFGELAAGLDRSRPLVQTKLAAAVGHLTTRLATCTGVEPATIQQLQVLVQ